MNLLIRPEQKQDYAAIQTINELAFNQKNEAKMVDALRKTPEYKPSLSLVAEVNEQIVAHILFYPITIKNKNTTSTVLSLAPMAVHPDYQNKGIGSKLVNKGLKIVKEHQYGAVIVVGHPTYYPRFGFQPASKWNIRLPFEVPDDVFLAIELEKNALKECSGTVEFPIEFYDAM